MSSTFLIQAQDTALVVIDVQPEFLKSAHATDTDRLLHDLADGVRLFRRLNAPVVTTMERPIESKGGLPPLLSDTLRGYTRHYTFEKEYFNLAGHAEINNTLRSLGRSQLVLCGAETDVCVSQSALSLLEQGYRVFLVDDWLFSSTPDTSVAKARLKAARASFLTWKSLFHEMVRAVESSPLRL